MQVLGACRGDESLKPVTEAEQDEGNVPGVPPGKDMITQGDDAEPSDKSLLVPNYGDNFRNDHTNFIKKAHIFLDEDVEWCGVYYVQHLARCGVVYVFSMFCEHIRKIGFMRWSDGGCLIELRG
ncbi:hypothetical protein F2Q69_00025061 [Brassica cretica]|uniref:Uncharacterized protein n=1 Tax=Brassica cretica TaxID=69181 RepID=A0A8S9QIA3_BRACR|nr:hypothetical protein F2Q69_00025061 [Brassica cretica]